MPVPYRWSKPRVEIEELPDSYRVVWQRDGRLLCRLYAIFGQDDRERAQRRAIAQREAREFVMRLEEVTDYGRGPQIEVFTDAEIEEREQAASLRAEMFGSYVDALADGETDVEALAAELGISAAQVTRDRQIVSAMRRLNERQDGLAPARRALAEFVGSVEDKRDLQDDPKLKRRLASLRAAVEVAQTARRDACALRSERPELFAASTSPADFPTLLAGVTV